MITDTHCRECGTHLALQREFHLHVEIGVRRQGDLYEARSYFDEAGAEIFCKACAEKFMQDFRNHYWRLRESI